MNSILIIAFVVIVGFILVYLFINNQIYKAQKEGVDSINKIFDAAKQKLKRGIIAGFIIGLISAIFGNNNDNNNSDV